MWVERCSVVDVFALAGEGCFDGHGLDIDVGLHHGCEVWWQIADFGRLQTAFVDEHGDFDTAAFGQVVNQTAVGDVAIDHAGLACFHAVDDKRAVFVAAVDFERQVVGDEVFTQLMPTGDLVFAAADVLVDGDVEFFDEIWSIALDEPWGVFGEVLGGFGDEIPEAFVDFVAYEVPIGRALFVEDLFDGWVEVLTVLLELEVEGHVVDAGGDVVDVVDVDADIVGELLGGPLDRVTQTDRLDGGGAGHRPAVHRHRIDIVEEGNVAGDFFHVTAHIEHDGDGAQATHDTADAQGVGNGLAQAVFFGDVEVDQRRGLVATDLKHGDGVVGVFEGLFAVGGGDDLGFGTECLGNLVGDDFRGFEALGVDVKEPNLAIGEFGERKDVAEQVFCKDGTAGT